MFKAIGKVLTVLLVFVLGFGAGWVYYDRQYVKNAQIVESTKESDLKLPGEVERRIVTESEIEVQLKKIGELDVYSGEYTVSKTASNTRSFLDDIAIPGTTNTIHIECSGIVKVGYDLDDIKPEVDNDSLKIYISLPEPEVLSNYLIWDTVQSDEKNSVLNPIDFEQYQLLIDELEEEGLAKVENEGIYEKAEENVKSIIEEYMAGFEGFQVVFL